jgi:hypothetical protein
LFGEVWVEEAVPAVGWLDGGMGGGSGDERTADVYRRLIDASV